MGISKHNRCGCGKIKDKRAAQCSHCSKRGYAVGGPYYDLNLLREAVESSLTYKEVAQKTGMSRSNASKQIKRFNLDISHFKGTGKRPAPIERYLKDESGVQSNNLKKRLVDEGYLKYVCNWCGISKWRGVYLTLELDHINGNCWDNTLKNLRLLCPNCHTQTPTNKGKNKKYK